MALSVPDELLDRLLAASSEDRTALESTYAAGYQSTLEIPNITVNWLDDAGAPIGLPQLYPLTTAPVEAFRSDGTIEPQHRAIPYPLEAAPEGAHRAQFNTLARTIAEVGLEALTPDASRMPSVEPRCWPEQATGDLFFPVFAERFADAGRFYDHVAQLNDFMRQIAPFDRPEIASRLQLRAYFWSTPTDGLGWFNTPDKPFDCASTETSLFYGDRDIAKKRIGHLMYEGQFGLVLVDSPYRGGAGGQPEYGYPAWSTITSCTGEDWCAVAVHEIGHAFGLGDEYVLDSLADKERNGEPNVGINVNVPPAAWQPSPGWEGRIITSDEQADMRADVPGTEAIVGYFQGARYRYDYCRPSLNCLMRTTSKIPSINRNAFCRVCEEALAAAINPSPAHA